jgi:alkanesulfonate monooxygenase SsuD/methylene tetrahydromethanopterin reductase-like flavin-dependent oxidoreductase (luciferase family)
MKIGITLPSFSPDAGAVIAAAQAAEAAGVHGVFLFDHLWPMGDPTRPALSLYPLAGAVLARTRRIVVGSLVARIGLLPDEVVLASLSSLAELAGGRFIAAIGTGDSSSADENERYGIPYPSAQNRRDRLREVARDLHTAGIETWIGGGAGATNEIAGETGATLNLWGVAPEEVRAASAEASHVSWAGPLPKDGSAPRVLQALDDAGATWSVWGWPRSLDLVVATAEQADIGLHPASG